MPDITQSIVIRAPREKVWDVLADFATYPKFQHDVKLVEIQSHTKNSAVVSFTIELIAKVHYTLKFQLKHPSLMSWTAIECDSVVRKNKGSWRLSKRGPNLTDLTCAMEVEFGVWIPKAIAGALMHSHFPAMLERFKERAEARCRSKVKAHRL